MKALAKLALILCLTLSPLLSFGQTHTVDSAPPDFSRAELDQMLAPIALYPDTVLSHVLIAATYPLEVVQADRWARTNSKLDAQAAVNAVENEDWDPSVKALVAFPEILQRMSEDLDWTQRVGDAFLADESEVMGVIQDLRQKAYASGSLDKLEYVRVQREEKVIVIEPAVERVVYVPYYDSRVVYGGWWWPGYPPVYWHHPRNHLVVGGFYWGPRVYVAPSFYFSSFHWHRRHVVVVDYHRHHHHPRFYSGRSIARYEGARHWRHNPHHRRGVVYRNDNLRHHYGSKRESYRNLQEQRHSTRHVSADGQSRSNHVSGQRNEREQDRISSRTNTRPNAQTNSRRDAQAQPAQRLEHKDSQGSNIQPSGQSDADRVRARLANRNLDVDRNQHRRENTSRTYTQTAGTRKLEAQTTGERPRDRERIPTKGGDNPGADAIGQEHQERTAVDRPSLTTSNIAAQTRAERNENRPQNTQRQERIQRTERAERPQVSPRSPDMRRAEPARQQVQRPSNSGGNHRGGEGSYGREGRRIER